MSSCPSASPSSTVHLDRTIDPLDVPYELSVARMQCSQAAHAASASCPSYAQSGTDEPLYMRKGAEAPCEVPPIGSRLSAET